MLTGFQHSFKVGGAFSHHSLQALLYCDLFLLIYIDFFPLEDGVRFSTDLLSASFYVFSITELKFMVTAWKADCMLAGFYVNWILASI